jgi:hypothetical protein
VQVVELDPVVVRVVDEVLRVPFHRAASLAAATCAPRGRFELLQAEGGAALEELAAAVRRGEQEGVSSLFLDAFDAAAEVPSHMRAPPFLAAAWLHDIGLVGVPRGLIRKWQHEPATLADAERVLMEQHPAMGEELADFVANLKDVGRIIRGHHVTRRHRNASHAHTAIDFHCFQAPLACNGCDAARPNREIAIP